MVLFYPLAKPVALLLDAGLHGQELLPNCEAELVTMLERQVKQGIIDEEVRCLALPAWDGWIGRLVSRCEWSDRTGRTTGWGVMIFVPRLRYNRWGARCGGR